MAFFSKELEQLIDTRHTIDATFLRRSVQEHGEENVTNVLKELDFYIFAWIRETTDTKTPNPHRQLVLSSTPYPVRDTLSAYRHFVSWANQFKHEEASSFKKEFEESAKMYRSVLEALATVEIVLSELK